MLLPCAAGSIGTSGNCRDAIYATASGFEEYLVAALTGTPHGDQPDQLAASVDRAANRAGRES